MEQPEKKIETIDTKVTAEDASQQNDGLGKGEVYGQDTNADPALRFTGGAVVEYTPEEEKAVMWKIDSHMLPLMCWVYMIQFADKTTLNYANLMNIQADTHLVGNDYSWVSSIFYAGYLAWE